jgi:hypothetical protein
MVFPLEVVYTNDEFTAEDVLFALADIRLED